MDCVFCKIMAGEIPSKTVYEDEYVKAFYDINPCAPVHVLVVPKVHIPSLNGITEENSSVVSHVFETIPKIAKQLKLDNGYRVIANCGADAGQTVLHIHFHVISGVKMGEKLL
jgi:histidine triad (HIT) family protein